MTEAKKHDPTETKAKSWRNEADMDYKEGLRYLRLYEHPTLGGWSHHLRKASLHFKMAARELEYSEHLQGNTLEEWVKK